ncbi:hypothetical protein K491DRAFT_593233 [Lophiostoma macrostomum CBS 122681]|uniref:Uncharacterized protein n=1 Tax=Lophiostoma macrostomum CBS 122681 TaxID=1314788 RepID=A0A6A6THA7_9PLEO|nr:hypothetical protein K491DRAFT_593233 [Lophiostoma macrostomum CBS 122681]
MIWRVIDILTTRDKQRKRHQFTKAHIHKDHDKAISSTKTAIATLFDDHEAQASLAHEAQMHRLRRLLDEKKKVETQMQTKITALRKEYRSHASDLQRAAEQRARQLS